MSTDPTSACTDPKDSGLYRILEVSRRLGTSMDLDQILEAVVAAACEVLQADRGTVFIYDRASNELFSEVATGAGELRFPATLGIAGETAQTMTMVNVPDCYADDRFNPEIDHETGYHTRNLLSIPLIGIQEDLVGVLQVLNKREGAFTREDEDLARVLAAQCGVALQRAGLFEQYLEKQRLEKELAVARDIQLGILPERLPELEGYQLAAWTRPADETGGDLYDAVRMEDGRVAILLADATGHGLGPALNVSQMRAMFRMGLRLTTDIESVIWQINSQLKQDLPLNQFITTFLGLLDAAGHRIVYHSGGQGPLMHFHHQQGRIEWLGASTVPLGILPKIPLGDALSMEMSPGDVVALLSDGFYEFADPSGEQFGQERVEELILAHPDESPEALIELLCEAVRLHSKGHKQDDDMTAFIVKRAG